MTAPFDEFLVKWHRIVAERDLPALPAVLAKDVSLGAPPYWGKVEGRDLVGHLLGLIVHTIEGFTYHREWRDGPEFALEFRGRVGKIELQGIDLITVNERGEVQNLDVMIRPLNAVVALRETIAPKMAAFLAERSGNAA